jgi:GT2 family glycosyltransferase
MSEFIPAIVIPTYRRADLVLRCVDSIIADGFVGGRYIIIVEDGPADDTQSTAVSEITPDPIFLSLGTNRGFAAAANTGIRHAMSQLSVSHVALLNNDTIVTPGWLDILSARLRDKHWDFVVPRMCILNEPTVIEGDGDLIDRRGRNVRRNTGALTSEVGAEPERVMFPTGGASVVSCAAYDRVGLFDERLRMYWEDADWGLRAMALGITGGVEPEALVLHEGSATAGQILCRANGYENYLVVTLSRLPSPYFRKCWPSWLSGFIRTTIYTVRGLGLSQTLRLAYRVLRQFRGILARRREIVWSDEATRAFMVLLAPGQAGSGSSRPPRARTPSDRVLHRQPAPRSGARGSADRVQSIAKVRLSKGHRVARVNFRGPR